MKIRNKLRSRRGETLTETLVALLVVALASVILATMIGTATRINAAAIQRDETLCQAVTAMETGTEAVATDGTVTVNINGGSVNFDGNYYSYAEEEGEDPILYAYGKKEGSGP